MEIFHKFSDNLDIIFDPPGGLSSYTSPCDWAIKLIRLFSFKNVFFSHPPRKIYCLRTLTHAHSMLCSIIVCVSNFLRILSLDLLLYISGMTALLVLREWLEHTIVMVNNTLHQLFIHDIGKGQMVQSANQGIYFSRQPGQKKMCFFSVKGWTEYFFC